MSLLWTVFPKVVGLRDRLCTHLHGTCGIECHCCVFSTSCLVPPRRSFCPSSCLLGLSAYVFFCKFGLCVVCCKLGTVSGAVGGLGHCCARLELGVCNIYVCSRQYGIKLCYLDVGNVAEPVKRCGSNMSHINWCEMSVIFLWPGSVLPQLVTVCLGLKIVASTSSPLIV